MTAFCEPELRWDFRLERVRSINVSNHKFGLVYPGMGTVVFREEQDLPEELVFHIDYLGGDMPNYSLNFSRPSNSVILQYFNFLRLGREGYRAIVSSVLANARALAGKLGEHRRIDAAQRRARSCRSSSLRAEDAEKLDLTLLSRRLRERGWIVPAYTLPANAEHITVLRLVVKENFSRDMADILAHDMRAAIHTLEHDPPTRGKARAAPADLLRLSRAGGRRLTSSTAPTTTITAITTAPTM